VHNNETTLRLKFCFLMLIVIVSIGIVCSLEPIPQAKEYHAFADSQEHFGVANANDVISNAAFIIAGVIGLIRIRQWVSARETKLWRFFFFSVILVGFGSAYYHLQPSNTTLVWDRLPMTMGFAALTACVLDERIGGEIGRKLFLPLVFSGLFSVIYWWATELAGAGDLRFYILTQYLPMLLIPAVLLLFPRPWRHSKFYWLLLCCYSMAKFFELHDAVVFKLTHQMLSGHTLKHLAAAAGILLFRPVAPAAPDSNHARNTILLD
jgi:hypothetical protein